MNNSFFRKNIYMDNSATTKTRSEVYAVMKRYMTSRFGNPSSVHKRGIIARGSIELARENIAKVLGCLSSEIIFTGSGSEANNMAIRGIVGNKRLENSKIHAITSKIEHSSILATYKALENEGIEVTYLDVDKNGRYNLNHLKESINSNTALISLSYVNNEIETIQEIEKIISITKERGIKIHIDAVQALPYIKMNLHKIGVDFVSFSGHKLNAPKGIGILYIKTNTKIEPIISGGEQEFGFRSGTENVPYIMGLSKAIQLNDLEKEKTNSILLKMKEKLVSKVINTIPDVIITGDPENRIPGHASFCFKGINGKQLVRELSWKGFEISSGSACSSKKESASNVLSAIRINQDYINGSIRISLGKDNNSSQIEKLVKELSILVKKLRETKESEAGIMTFVSQTEFKEKLEKGFDMQILDVRPISLPKLNIPLIIQMPLWKIKSVAKKLNKEKETIVICYHGDVAAPESQYYLNSLGFKNVRVLKGGANEYNFVQTL